MSATDISSILPTIRHKIDDIIGEDSVDTDNVYRDDYLSIKIAQAVWEIEARNDTGRQLVDINGVVTHPADAVKITPELDYELRSTKIYLNMLADIVLILARKLIPSYTFDTRNANSEGQSRTAPRWRVEKSDSELIDAVTDKWVTILSQDSGSGWENTTSFLSTVGITFNLNLDDVNAMARIDKYGY